jgi:hypothetical protein
MDGSPSWLTSGNHREVQKRFGQLLKNEQLSLLLQMRGKERLRTLFLSDDPKELVQRLPDIELFLMIKEVGRRDAVDLVSLMSPSQLQYVFDLEFWRKDFLDPKKALRWLEILVESGEQKVIEFIQSAEPEVVALLLAKLIHVTRFDPETPEVLNRTLGFTLDREYYIAFKAPQGQPIVQPFLEALYTAGSEAYRLYMESLLCELESDLEETAYRFRSARLADHGFPTFEEAIEIYQFVDPGTLNGTEPCFDLTEEDREGVQPAFYLASRSEGPFFSRILSRVTDGAEIFRLRAELARLCNKAMIAEPVHLSDIGEMDRVIRTVFHYLNVGLQHLSGEEDEKAAHVLRATSVQRVFQSGLGLTLRLRKRAEGFLKNAWFQGRKQTADLLDPADRERLEGFLNKRPRFVRNGNPDDFRDLRDIRDAEAFLGRMEAGVDALSRGLNFTPDEFQAMDLADCVPEDKDSVSLSMLFNTALANRVLYGRFFIQPIDRDRLADVVSLLFERDERGNGRIRMDIRRVVEETTLSEANAEKTEHLLAFWDFCLDLLEAEYGRIPASEEIDPRFVQSLLVRK